MTAEFLIAPVVTAFVTSLLGALISITDRVVNNYGTVTIDINKGKRQLSVNGGSPLLFSLAENNIFIPSACGGRGSCGTCKCKVVSDVGPTLPTELPYLSKKEQAEQVRLSCQVKLKSDIAIEIPESLFNIRSYAGTVKQIRDLTYDIKEILIKLDEPKEIDFVAGQYGQIEVPPYEKVREKTQRAYSMSSRPLDKNHVEFLVRLVPGGTVTSYVFKYLKENDKIKVVGPFGDFGLRDTDATMLCVAGGSGMAPFKALFYDMIDKGNTSREVWYFFGARAKRDLFYFDELEDIKQKYGEKFHYVMALSEPQPDDAWNGETGLITEVLEKYLKNSINGEKSLEGYLCGSPGMLDASMAVMKKHGIPEDRIFFDKFA